MSRWHKRLVSIVLVYSCLLGAAQYKTVHATNEVSPWLSSPPTLSSAGDVPSAQLPTSLGGNRDCQPREIITRPARINPVQTKQSYQGCTIDTAYGSYDSVGYLQRPGTTTFGRVVNSTGVSSYLIPVPYSSTGIVTSAAVNGSYLFFIKDLDQQLSTSIIYNGELTHKLPIYSGAVKDVSGRLLPVDTESLSFSNNGSWAVASLPGIGTARINMNTFEVLPFGDSVNYNIGIGPSYKTAISPDGRYAVVASMGFEIIKLYDLSTCGPVPTTITTKVSCQYRDLLSFMRQRVPGYRSVVQMRFYGGFILDMYVSAVSGSSVMYSHQTMKAVGQESQGFEYLALGDSFASGEGAYQYKAATDTTQNKCHLSQRSYPYLIAAKLNYGQYESVACSGAKINDLTNSTKEYNDNQSQADGKSDPAYDNDIISYFLPGYRAQKLFAETRRPNIITVSAVGNDIGFSDKIKRCLDSDICYSSYEDRLEIVQEVNAQFYRLTDMYAQLKRAARSDTRIYVIGYPQIGDPNGNCADNVHLNHDELVFAQQMVGYLNLMIKTAAANQGVFYVDVEQAFAGHRLCETDSWNVVVNGLTAGNDIANLPLIHGPVGNESYHPNAYGHELFKETILAKTNNLTSPMPQPNPSSVMSEPSSYLDILNAPKSNRPVKILRSITGTEGGVIQTGKEWSTRVTGIGTIIKARSSLHGWLNSNPVDLGVFTVSAEGDVELHVTLPASVPSGFHTLHLYGKNAADEDLDFYMTVYVTNGEVTACSGLPVSGHDQDKDGTDDACDAFIDQAPPEPIVVEPPQEIPIVEPAQPEPIPPVEVTPPTETPPVEVETPTPNPDPYTDQATVPPEEHVTEAPDKPSENQVALLQPPTEVQQSTQSAQTTTIFQGNQNVTNSLEKTGVAGVQAVPQTTPYTSRPATKSTPNPQSKEKFNLWLLSSLITVFSCILYVRKYWKKS